MKKVAYIFSFALIFILVVVFVVWTRISNNRWMVYVAPLLIGAIIFIVIYLIDIINRKKEKKVSENMKNSTDLPISLKFLLWDRYFDVKISYAQVFQANNVMVDQKAQFDFLQQMLTIKKHEIECALEKYYFDEYELEDKQVLISEFKPQTLTVTRNNQYALIGYGLENAGDEGFALVIDSELDIMPQGEYYRLCSEN